MKKYIKTYAVFGLIEWVLELLVNKKILLIDFTGGAINGYGITPATYRTANQTIQNAIENSKYFKNKRIVLYKETLIAEEKPIELIPVVIPELTQKAEEIEEVVEDEPATIALTQVEVSDLPAAQDYLVENFGITHSKVRSKVATIAFAKEKGIEFIGI